MTKFNLFLLFWGALMTYLAYMKTSAKMISVRRFILAIIINAVAMAIWSISLFFLIDGCFTLDVLLGSISLPLYPALYIVWFISVRRRTKELEQEVQENEEQLLRHREQQKKEMQEADEKLKHIRELNADRLKSEAPLIVDKSNDLLICPKCGKSQRSDRRFCAFCNANFL